MILVTIEKALMPGSNTPKPPGSQIHSWPGCQWRTSSFQFTNRRLTVLPASNRLASSTAALYCECQVVNRMRPWPWRDRPWRRARQPSASAAFRSAHASPHRAPRARCRKRGSGGMHSDTASSLRPLANSSAGVLKLGTSLYAAARTHRCREFEILILGDAGQVLVLGNLAEADDGEFECHGLSFAE